MNKNIPPKESTSFVCDLLNHLKEGIHLLRNSLLKTITVVNTNGVATAKTCTIAITTIFESLSRDGRTKTHKNVITVDTKEIRLFINDFCIA